MNELHFGYRFGDNLQPFVSGTVFFRSILGRQFLQYLGLDLVSSDSLKPGNRCGESGRLLWNS